MTIAIIAIIGGIVGLIHRAGVDVGRRFNGIFSFIIGAVGGVLGVWFFVGVLRLLTVNYSINILLVALWTIVGALILLAVVDALSYSMYRSRERREERRAERSYARDYDRRKSPKTKRIYAKDYEVIEEEHTITKTRKK